MISRAEQQFVLKMDPGKELDSIVVRDVLSASRIKSKLVQEKNGKIFISAPWRPFFDSAGTMKQVPSISDQVALALSILEALGEPTKISRSKDSDEWEIFIGAAKKVITVKSVNLAEGICKATILFTRKFL